jgi:hypothetical protein
VLISAAIAERSSRSRSVVSNGRLHPRKTLDGRSSEARRFRDLVERLSEPFGGLERLSESEVALVRTAASLTVSAEALQAKAATGEPLDLEALTRLSNAQTRIFQALRRKTSPPVTQPSFAEKFAARHAERGAA